MMRLYIVWFYIIGGLYCLTSCTSVKPMSGYDKKWQDFDKVFQDSFGHSGVHTGFALYDAETMKMVYGYQPDHRLLPASNTKILTCYLALKYLPEHLHGLQYFKHGDTTYVRGMGDPGFMNMDFEGDAIMDFLKEQNHIQYVVGPECVKRWGPGWSWDDYPYYYTAERSIWPVNSNVISFDNTYNRLNSHFVFNKIQSETNRILRVEDHNIYNVYLTANGQVSSKKTPFKWSEELLLDILKDTLGNRLIDQSIDGADWMSWQVLPGSKRDSVVRQMMEVSDNFLAEQLLINIAAGWGNMKTGYEAITKILETDWYEWQSKIRWVDGSGLSRYNLMSPSFLCFVLGQMYQSHPSDRLFEIFPSYNLISNQYPSSEAKKQFSIYAKTGSMSGVYCLSGYIVTESGRKYIFSFMNNNFIGSSADIKRAMANILQRIGDQ